MRAKRLPWRDRIEAIAALLDRLLNLGLFLFGLLIFAYAAYALWDDASIGASAFSNRDLKQFKPVLQAEEPDFEELRAMNPDVVGWITIPGTHIDYPVAQGQDDLEYAEKDIFGNPSITGSVYLAAKNAPDFSDGYSILYGHHLDNGAMFGDIDLFAEEDFFETHRDGLLVSPETVYDLRIVACIHTDAYEGTVYGLSREGNAIGPALLEYIREHADVLDEAGLAGAGKLVALSTCANATTNGRIVLFAAATIKEETRKDMQGREETQ